MADLRDNICRQFGLGMERLNGSSADRNSCQNRQRDGVTRVFIARRPLASDVQAAGHGGRPGMDTERKAPSFVIQVTNGTGSVRQFASKAARCEARAAFELCGLAARASAQKYSQIRLSRPEAVTAANATRNAVIRSLSIVPENVARILGSYIATARETPPDLTRSRDAPRK